jgi:hypothetical protein
LMNWGRRQNRRAKAMFLVPAVIISRRKCENCATPPFKSPLPQITCFVTAVTNLCAEQCD